MDNQHIHQRVNSTFGGRCSSLCIIGVWSDLFLLSNWRIDDALKRHMLVDRQINVAEWWFRAKCPSNAGFEHHILKQFSSAVKGKVLGKTELPPMVSWSWLYYRLSARGARNVFGPSYYSLSEMVLYIERHCKQAHAWLVTGTDWCFPFSSFHVTIIHLAIGRNSIPIWILLCRYRLEMIMSPSSPSSRAVNNS